MNLNLAHTIENELQDITTTEDVFDQLLELHNKVKKVYGVTDFDEEDFGTFLRKTFKRRDYKHLLKTMAHQKSSTLKEGAVEELEAIELELETKRLVKTFTTKTFKPTKEHLQLCLGCLDDVECLTTPIEAALQLRTLFNQHYCQ